MNVVQAPTNCRPQLPVRSIAACRDSRAMQKDQVHDCSIGHAFGQCSKPASCGQDHQNASAKMHRTIPLRSRSAA